MDINQDLFSFLANHQDATVPASPDHKQNSIYHASMQSTDSPANQSDLLPYLDIEDFPLDLSFPVSARAMTLHAEKAKGADKGETKPVVAAPTEDSTKNGKKTPAASAPRKRKFTGPPKEGKKETAKKGGKRAAKQTEAAKEKEAAKAAALNEEPEDEELDEEKSAKRQRRLLKNREAAQLFRQRQKAYIQEMEKKVAKLSAETAQYKSKLDLLSTENKMMKEQMAYLRTFLSQVMMSVSAVATVPPPGSQ